MALSVPSPYALADRRNYVSPWAASHFRALLERRRRRAAWFGLSALLLFCLADIALIAGVIAYTEGALDFAAAGSWFGSLTDHVDNPLIVFLAGCASRKSTLIGTAFLWSLIVAGGALLAAIVGIGLVVAFIRQHRRTRIG